MEGHSRAAGATTGTEWEDTTVLDIHGPLHPTGQDSKAWPNTMFLALFL